MNARIISVLCVVGVIAGCSDGCNDKSVTELKSPDSTYVATLFQRDCGATTGFSTQISILKAEESLSGGGNTFVADDNHGAAADGRWGGPLATMRWTGTRKLAIHYAAGSRLFLRRAEVSGVAISYSVPTH